jgi:hypothetical protein
MFDPLSKYLYSSSSVCTVELMHALKSTKAMFLNGLTNNKTTKNAIVYGHKSLGDIGYFNPYIEQGLSSLKIFVSTIQDERIAGNLLRAAVNTWQWQLGSGYNPFQTSYVYSHDETKWLKEFRSFKIK